MGKNRNKTVMTVGYLDEVENEYEDPIAHFTEVARQMTEAQKKKTAPLILSIAHDKQMPLGTDSRKNLGHVVFPISTMSSSWITLSLTAGVILMRSTTITLSSNCWYTHGFCSNICDVLSSPLTQTQ